MRSARCLTVTFAALFAALTCGHGARADVLSIPKLNPCTVVAVQMMEDVDSGAAQPGDFFRFETINAVTVGNTITIPARTMGYGIVAIASAAGRNGRPGALVLEPRYLDLPEHAHLGVVLNHNASVQQIGGKSGTAPGYLGALPVPLLGAAIGIFNYFRHGQNVLVKKGTIFSIFPSDGPATEKCQEHPSY